MGIFLSNNFYIDAQVCNVLKMCSQQVYLLKILREQGLSREQLHTEFLALIIVSRLRYALPSWSVLISGEQVGQINAF